MRIKDDSEHYSGDDVREIISRNTLKGDAVKRFRQYVSWYKRNPLYFEKKRGQYRVMELTQQACQNSTEAVINVYEKQQEVIAARSMQAWTDDGLLRYSLTKSKRNGSFIGDSQYIFFVIYNEKCIFLELKYSKGVFLKSRFPFQYIMLWLTVYIWLASTIA